MIGDLIAHIVTPLRSAALAVGCLGSEIVRAGLSPFRHSGGRASWIRQMCCRNRMLRLKQGPQ